MSPSQVSTPFASLAMAALRLSPIVLSSATITSVAHQHVVFAMLLSTNPSIVRPFSRKIMWIMGSLYPISLLSLLINATIPSDAPHLQSIYGLGFALTLAHVGPFRYAGRLRGALEDEKVVKDELDKVMREWHTLNWWRLWVCDLPAWGVIFCATIKAFV
ncbi:hypothetical protein BCR34DRAFT_60921 [Clohesyomyces aquaticus]|uniref:Uncharacterized protein n=1 Tax=Clohesyomyces aquaticus TaxID=1231657 RepID=A0A1Y2A3K4_9PLEO|nr:hypothetical protein BCR34DRAFT_60921 [Clohesyomyces aquaticus]